jgi:hypothetical protein
MRPSSTVLDAGKLAGSGTTGSPVVAVGNPEEFNPPIVTAVFSEVMLG